MAAGNLGGHVAFPEGDTGDVAADTGIAITIDLQFTDVMRHQGRRAGVFARQQRRETGTVLGILNAAGLKKWMPTTLSGCSARVPIMLTMKPELSLASIVSGALRAPSSWKICCL